MKLEGDFTFDAPPERVWKTLLDPQAIAKSMPGCDGMEEVGENQYKAIMNVKVGPVQGRFDGTVRLSDIQPMTSYRLTVQGKGSTGFMKGDGVLSLRPAEEAGKTAVHYSVDAQVGGRIAGIGQRLLETTAKSITRQSLETLNSQMSPDTGESGSDSGQAAAPPPSATRIAAGVAKDVVADYTGTGKSKIVVIVVAAIVLAFLILLLLRL